MTATEPSWAEDRLSVASYRLQAAHFGIQLRIARARANFVNLASLTVGAIGVALTVTFVPLSPLGEIYGTALSRHTVITALATAIVLTITLWLIIRHLGNLDRLMRIASERPATAEEMQSRMAEGMRNVDGYAKIMEVYEADIEAANEWMRQQGLEEFRRVHITDGHGLVHQHAAIAAPLRNPTSLNNILYGVPERQTPNNDKFSKFAESRQKLMKVLRRDIPDSDIRDIEKGDNYYAVELSAAPDEQGLARLRIGVSVARYGHILRSCDALINEFALFCFIAGGGCRTMRRTTLLKCLPWRRKIEESAQMPGDTFLHPYNRVAGLGIAASTVLLDSDKMYVGLGMRSPTVGTYPSCFHVIPAGMCNTHGTDNSADKPPSWYLEEIMRSEFLEEWYDDEGLVKARIPNWRKEVDQKWTEKLSRKPIYLTGLAFDLLNMRPELCAEVLVTEWGERLCWEYISGVAQYEEDLRSPNHIGEIDIVQSGAAAIYLAQNFESVQ